MKLTLKEAYADRRRFGVPPAKAIVQARKNVGKETFVSGDLWRDIYPPYGNFGPKYEAYGESHMRWVEEPYAAGLRRVGTVAEILESIRHTGWYVDSDFGETVQGCVYRLAAKDGASRFIAGHDDPWNDDAACGLSFDEIFDCEREAARRADGIAERMAESEREHQRRSENEMRADEIPDEIRGLLCYARELLCEIRTLPGTKPLSPTHPATAATVWREIEKYRETAAELRTEYETLKADPLHGFAG